MSTLLNSKEVLEVLGLYNPKVHKSPNGHYVSWLVERNLLPRIELGPRTFRYELSDVKDLKERVITQGIILTIKP